MLARMSVAALKLMTADEFLEWSLHQEDRYELVDGRPVLMPGARQSHDDVVVNLLEHLSRRLRGKPCRPRTADVAARMTKGNVRRPDVTIDCGPRRPDSAESHGPTVFFEVLSPSTRRVDLVRKANEYRTLPGLKHFVLIEPDTVLVQVWSLSPEGEWGDPVELEALADEIDLAAVGVRLPLAEVYEGVIG